MTTKVGNSHVTITLVHGTWGRTSAWIQKTSSLYKLLSAFWGEECIHVFRWSGWNSHRARIRAGGRLAQSLTRQFESNPGAKHFVIAHSHGGNVAMYALRNERVKKSLSGMVLMGVPFIDTERRDVDESLGILLHVRKAVLLLWWLSMFFAFFFLDHFSQSPLAAVAAVLWILACVLLSLVMLFESSTLPAFLDTLRRFAERHQDETMRRLALPDIRGAGIPLFCARAKGDEAYWGLRLSRALSNAPYIFWQPRSQGLSIGVAIFLPLAAPFFPTLYGWLDHFLPMSVFGPVPLAAKSFVLYAGLCVVVQLLMLSLPFITLSQFVFGGETILDGWFTRIGVSPVPQGASQTANLSIQSEIGRSIYVRSYDVSGRGFRHCQIYNSKEFLRDIQRLPLDQTAIFCHLQPDSHTALRVQP